jgi:hypothetical protein
MNEDSKKICNNFLEDYKMKEYILQNYNEMYNNFLINDFETLPNLLKEIYVPPFDFFFRKTIDAENILYNINSYKLEKKILKINYEEYNIMYNYEIKFS